RIEASLRVIECYGCGFILVGDGDLSHARHCFKACFHRVRTRCAIHVLHRKGNRLLGRCGGRRRQGEREYSRYGYQELGHGALSIQGLRSSGARRAKHKAATTRTVAVISTILTSRFGKGRAQASPSTQARFEARWTSQWPVPRNAIVATRKYG